MVQTDWEPRVGGMFALRPTRLTMSERPSPIGRLRLGPTAASPPRLSTPQTQARAHVAGCTHQLTTTPPSRHLMDMSTTWTQLRGPGRRPQIAPGPAVAGRRRHRGLSCGGTLDKLTDLLVTSSSHNIHCYTHAAMLTGADAQTCGPGIFAEQPRLTERTRAVAETAVSGQPSSGTLQ
ncbi:hypothetical protein DPEC_G00068350 [Dallia pectoralis]|uniref:Uncharacterized protein n=1 Tax=Dallia pectoralis TaxID=75939 RepID=A0ACC2H1C7_DALPE|nr:hypothetical protein DPEC_G00068350 [Dallia pectoralis]